MVRCKYSIICVYCVKRTMARKKSININSAFSCSIKTLLSIFFLSNGICTEVLSPYMQMLYYKPLSLHLPFFQNLHLFQARQEVPHADHPAVVPGRKKFS